jgi:hypothetical protein
MATPVKLKVVGKRSYHWKARNRFMKPGEIFTGIVDELPEELRVMVVVIDSPPVEIKKEPQVRVIDRLSINSGYRIEERKGGEYYNIVDTNGKKINSQKLTFEEAESMLKTL